MATQNTSASSCSILTNQIKFPPRATPTIKFSIIFHIPALSNMNTTKDAKIRNPDMKIFAEGKKLGRPRVKKNKYSVHCVLKAIKTSPT